MSAKSGIINRYSYKAVDTDAGSAKTNRENWQADKDLAKRLYKLLKSVKEAEIFRDAESSGFEVFEVDDAKKAEYRAVLLKYSPQDFQRLSELAKQILPELDGNLDMKSGTVVSFVRHDEIYTDSSVYTTSRFRSHLAYDKADISRVDRSDEPLFSHEPNLSDIRQGTIGDCFMLSGLAMMIQSDPSSIKRNMRDLGDRVAVRFENFGRPVIIEVKKTTFRVDGGRKALGVKNECLWVQMYEKAYATLLAGYVPGADGNQDREFFAQRVHDPHIIGENPYSAIDGGRTENFLEFAFGKKVTDGYWRTHYLTGFHFEGQTLPEVIDTAHQAMRTEYMQPHQDKTEWGWTAFKAGRLFGINLQRTAGREKYDIFQQNNLFGLFVSEFDKLIRSREAL